MIRASTIPTSKDESKLVFLPPFPEYLVHVETNARKELDEQGKPDLSTVNGSASSVHQLLMKIHPEKMSIDHNLTA